MHARHMPIVEARYWLAITLASLFGTNLGDLYADQIGLSIYGGVGLLVLLAAAVFVLERRDARTTELYYWLVIILIRTGATNVADFLAYHVHIPDLPLALGLGAWVVLFGWLSMRRHGAAEEKAEATGMPATGAAYWLAMLGAGVFGTAVGDMAQHAMGQGTASVALGGLLLAALALWWGVPGRRIGVYWLLVAVARTTGTAMGDWLAESSGAGLTVATAITGVAFVATVLLRRKAGSQQLGLI